MAPEADTKTETTQTTTPIAAQPPKAVNPAAVKKAITLGKDVRKQPKKTKADAARAMFELISGEPREIVVRAFVDARRVFLNGCFWPNVRAAPGSAAGLSGRQHLIGPEA